MALPEANITIQDGALGLSNPSGANVLALIGACSSGTVSTAYSFSDITTLKATLGTGPLVECAAHVLAIAGGSVICYKPAAQTPGSMGSVTATKTGSATLAVSGTPLDAYRLKVLIVTGAGTLAVGTATFKYSLDGGASYSAEIALPAAGIYAIPNTGLTLTWTYTSGTAFVAGDYWTGTATGPSVANGDIASAVSALCADASLDFFAIKVVGEASSIANAGTLFSLLSPYLDAAASSQFRYVYLLLDLPEDTDANIKATFDLLAHARMAVSAGFCDLASSVSGFFYKRSAGWVVAARAAKVGMSEDLGKVRTGPCAGVDKLHRDEFKTQGLDAARLSTLRTFIGKQGFYVTTGRILAASGSDFAYQQHRRVMDAACSAARKGMLEFLNDSILVNSSTGFIQETEARSIEANIEGRIRTALSGHVSDVQVTVNRTENMLSSQTLKLTVRIVPLGYARTVSAELGFYNPALQPT